MPKLLKVAFAACGCAAALIAAPAASAADCAGQDLRIDEQSAAEVESSVLCLINDQRASAGLGAVSPNSKLRDAAAHHSNDMVSGGYFAHTSPSGESFIDRITATGYMQGARSWLVGENLVWGSGELGTPASMVQAWMDSPPHRANLLRSQFREIGIAAVAGTPFEAGDPEGVTVSSEYGNRGAAKKKKARKARKAKARQAKARRARARTRHR
jgi:uncharacterized protein YkwD